MPPATTINRMSVTLSSVKRPRTVLIGIFGAIGVGAGTTSSSTTNTVAIAVGIGVGGFFVGAALAFFGYMLELVVGIKDDLGVLSYIAIGSEDDGDEGR